ncbi:MAG: DUF624 domain-containing protein [Anaerolineaceae bacterium]|nr:DUF624 domain-containing protein [Anaerolineaceae bacterium]
MKQEIRSAFNVIGKAFSLWWDDWVNQVLVSLAATLLGLTIVLAPAALMGLLQETQDLSNDLRTGLMGFWKGFKKNFWTSLLWGLITLIVFAIIVINIWFYYNIQTVWAPLLVVLFIILFFFWYIIQFFALGYFFEQEDKSLSLAWKNSILTILAAPFFTFIIAILVIIFSIISFGLILPMMVGMPALLSLLSILSIRNRLQAYEILPPSNYPS